MSSPRLEAFLARLYVDEGFRAAFSAAPLEEALKYGLTENEANKMADIDLIGLGMAAESFLRKRKKHGDGKLKPQLASLRSRFRFPARQMMRGLSFHSRRRD